MMIAVQCYPSLLLVNNRADFRLFRSVLFINAMPVFCAAWNGAAWLESALNWDSWYCISLNRTKMPLTSLYPQALMQWVLWFCVSTDFTQHFLKDLDRKHKVDQNELCSEKQIFLR